MAGIAKIADTPRRGEREAVYCAGGSREEDFEAACQGCTTLVRPATHRLAFRKISREVRSIFHGFSRLNCGAHGRSSRCFAREREQFGLGALGSLFAA